MRPCTHTELFGVITLVSGIAAALATAAAAALSIRRLYSATS